MSFPRRYRWHMPSCQGRSAPQLTICQVCSNTLCCVLTLTTVCHCQAGYLINKAASSLCLYNSHSSAKEDRQRHGNSYGSISRSLSRGEKALHCICHGDDVISLSEGVHTSTMWVRRLLVSFQALQPKWKSLVSFPFWLYFLFYLSTVNMAFKQTHN